MPGILSVLSNIPWNTPGATGPTSTLLWASNLQNVSLVTPITYNNTNTVRQFITSSGDDPTTGFNWTTDIQAIMGATVKPQILMIGQGGVLVNDAGLNAQVDARYDHQIDATDCPGVPASCFEFNTAVKIRDDAAANPQASLMWIADGDEAATLDPFAEFYYSFWYYIPADLNVLTSQTNGNWKTAMEYKTGRPDATGGSGVGDMRFSVVINGDNGYPEWQIKTDNQANGFSASPPMSGLGVAADDPYWQVVGGNMVGITLGAWHFIEVYNKRSVNHADITTGRAIVAVTPYGGTRVVVCNHTGGVMRGVEALPVTRFFLDNCYSSSPLPHRVRTTGFKIYDTMPYQMV